MGNGNHLFDPNSNARIAHHWQRRDFVKRVAALAGAAGLCACETRSGAGEPPPEVTKIRVVKIPGICVAPEYIAEELLRLEGFSEVQSVPLGHIDTDPLTDNRADFSTASAPGLFPEWDAGKRVIALAGIHGGCYELVAHDRVGAIRGLSGRRIAIAAVGKGTDYFYLASMLAFVGMDPRKDISWVEGGSLDGTMSLFVAEKADAFLGFPPQPQELRARNIGHVIVNTAVDAPWAQYFCCLVSARPEFVKENPVATKRALRAMLKAADICAYEPKRAARYVLAREYAPSYHVALEAVTSLSYDRWRTYNVEDGLRFFGDRLHETRMIKSDPQKLIAQGTDWRFLNELKREHKA
jgi:NitT/TauT family transport system substrate-binding protein